MRLVGKDKQLLDKMVEWQKDDVMRLKTNGTSVPYSEDYVRAYFDQTYDGHLNMLVGVESDSGTIVGAFMLDDIDRRNLRCYMHLQFEECARGSCSKSACTAIVNFAFQELHLKQLLGIISEDNTTALRFVEKMGWRKVAVLPEYYSGTMGFKDGIMVRLIPEWRNF